MPAHFFEQPNLNSPYAYPARHWELDPDGQPTNTVVESRRRSAFITPVSKPKKRRRPYVKKQEEMVFADEENLSTANQHPRKWHRLFAHAILYEGWTLWCEQMVADLRIDSSPWLRVQQLHDALWRVHSILVDLRLQTRRYSYEQAVRHLQRHLGFTQARASTDVNWYTAAPSCR